nr:hypothetical protein [Tanacetum cinerariifolium]
MEQMTQLTSMCELACQIIQKKQEDKRIEEEQAANGQYWKIPACCDDDDNYNSAITPKKQEDKRIEEEQAANGQYWKIPACCDDDDNYNSAITPVLSTEEPVNSLNIGDEHLDTISATESDEVIKSSVENLVSIPSESEGIPDTMCDVHLVNNPTPLKAKDHFEIVINSNDDISSNDDESLYNENIEYVEASPHNSELVSLEVAEIVIPEEEEIEDDNLREKLLNVHLLIANIEALKDNPTPSSEFLTKSSSTSPKSFLEETNTFHNSLPEFENFYFDLEEISSGSTTTHSDISLSEYDSFIFDLSKDQFPPTDRSDFTHEEFADELDHIISLLEYDCFYFRNLPDLGELISILNSGIRENPLSTTYVNLPVEDDDSLLLAYVVCIFLTYLTYPVIPPYLHSFGNEDTIFDPGITINRFCSFKPGLSHQSGTFKKFNTHRSHLNECSMIINEKNTPILDVPLFHFYPLDQFKYGGNWVKLNDLKQALRPACTGGRAAAVASPAGVLELDTHSSSEADPSESSPPPVSVAPMVSPFLCLDDSESDTEMPEKHVSPTPHDVMLTKWRSRVASRSSSPTTSTIEILTAAILPAPSTVDIPIGRLYRTHPDRPCRALTVRKSVRPLPSHRLALRYTSHPLDRFTFGSSSGHSSSDHSSSRHSISGLHGVARPIAVRGLPHYLPCIHRRHPSRQLGNLLSSHLLDHHRFRDSISPEDSVEEDIDADELADIKVDVGIDVKDDVEDEVESSDRGTIEVRVDVIDGIDIPNGMLMPDAIERLEQLEEVTAIMEMVDMEMVEMEMVEMEIKIRIIGVKGKQEKDKIGTKLGKNEKRGEARQCQNRS